MRRVAFGLLLVVLWKGSAAAAPVNLAWDPNREPDLAGYLVSYGTASGQYTTTVDIGNATTYTFNPPDPTRAYFIAVRAYNLGSAISVYSNEVSTPTSVPALLMTNLSANKISPQVTGTTTTFSATATGGTSPYQFKWFVADGATSTIGQNWSAASSFSWTPSQASPNYLITAWARSSGNAADAPENPSAQLSMPFVITAAPLPPPPPTTLTLNSLVANKPAPQVAGRPISFTANASGGVAPYQYQWRVFDGTAWTVAAAWSGQNTFRWTPATANPNYVVEVWVRNSGSQLNQPDASANLPYAIMPKKGN